MVREVVTEVTTAALGRPRLRSPRVQFARFLVVGAANAIIDVGVFNLVLLAPIAHTTLVIVADNTIAVLAAITNSYVWNCRWSFRSTSATSPLGRRRQRRLFLGQSLLNVATNDAVVALASTVLSTWFDLPPTLGSNVAKLCGMFSASMVSFAILETVVFPHRPPEDGN